MLPPGPNVRPSQSRESDARRTDRSAVPPRLPGHGAGVLSLSPRSHPHLFEVNAQLWLRRLARREARPLRLANVPDRDLETIAGRFDLLWVMGVWRRSPGARRCALESSGLRAAFDGALPGWTEGDVGASPYAVHGYEIDPSLGEQGDLAVLRGRLHRLGAGLIVDFIPNHVAVDNPWTLERPEWFVRGGDRDLHEHPGGFYRTGGGSVLAHARDPNFPPWTDTAQVDYDSPGLRSAFVETLSSIAQEADGVRCDMAMLGLSDVFHGVWGWTLGETDSSHRGEFWSEIIGRVKAVHPHFLFIAEAYWGRESRLLELGFDFAYDKRLYDLLIASDAPAIRRHLMESGSMLERGVRFVENHDERRAVEVFGKERSRAAALVAMTLPGMRFVHDGQIEGRRVRIPVQLLREPDEPRQGDVALFYESLLEACDAAPFHAGRWALLEPGPEDAEETARNLLAWSWTLGGRPHVVVVNLAGVPSRGHLRAPEWAAWPAAWTTRLGRAGPDGAAADSRRGLTVRLDPWEGVILAPP